ncbi:GNAT family N-acetyltransferase [Azohydromonas lata]|uniref:GNAT family N-acetyltransferase n=1 Tax=Azohydromonas lata TaxID=45677 RepID=A0ABU5I7U8_9BURK|nr:GNAT family N-acetyltransferase [Azohydromonas lata]MDZ5454972.1 GNAT family N-acetyltransferase [Azohydromonas lata]
MDCTIETMHRDEIGFAIELAAAEGWNPGLHDAECFHAADPGGFLVARCGGQAVGCIAAVSYAGRFGFIGLYIVAPGWRSQGIGRRLWDAGMARLAGQVVGLDGVPAQQAFYRRSGFELAWQNMRFAGTARHTQRAEAAQIVPIGVADFGALCALDRRVFPAPREAFLRRWIAMPGSTALAWMEGQRIDGWGLVRRCRVGHKIGPLVADDPAVASALYAALCNRVPEGDAVFLDVPLPNADAQALARAQSLQGVFATARMYAGAAPALELEQLYGVTTFELG